MDRKRLLRHPVVWILLVVVLYYAFSQLFDENRDYTKVPTSQAVAQVNSGNVAKADIGDKEQQLKLDLKSPVNGSKKVITQYPAGASGNIYNSLRNKNINFNTTVTQDSFLSQMLIFLIPLGLILLLIMWMMNNAQGGGNRVLNFGKSKAKQLSKDMPKNTFGDVAGADEAVEELHEIKDFLANPGRYQALGAKIPKGVLLYGPPGTGKTLLARAVAGEAGVPFYSISGSDFVEMFVGVGASRVRDLFEQAKQNAPCIVFVDEIDAVGRQRGAGLGGGHDEREQTLNQLLVEMDGFDTRGGIILIAATNRPDILDPALLRPGRFDRQIPVAAPDLAGRKAILKVHSKGKPFGQDVDFEGLAKRTIGMSGADLANVINEAALLTARDNEQMISAEALEESVDRVVGGPRRKSRIISEKEKKLTAYHEGGHALAAWAMPDIEPVYKLTIVARGRTGGHALAVPEDDKSLMTRSEMIARVVFALGGRAAEELVFHEPTTGASSDIDQATKIARSMVTEYGMSGRLGAVRYGQEQGDPFVGRQMGSQPDYSLEVAHEIDEEVRKLIEAAHTEAYQVLNSYRDVLDDLVVELLDKETLQRKDLERIFDQVEKRPRITDFNDFGERVPSDKPPVKTPAELAKERGEPWPPPGEEEEEREPTPVTTVPGGNDLPGGPPHGGPQAPNGSPNGHPGQGGYQPGPYQPGHGDYGGRPGGFPSGQQSPSGRSRPPEQAGQHGQQEPRRSGPPYYDAPPGWTPATQPQSPSPARPWRPSWSQQDPGQQGYDQSGYGQQGHGQQGYGQQYGQQQYGQQGHDRQRHGPHDQGGQHRPDDGRYDDQQDGGRYDGREGS